MAAVFTREEVSQRNHKDDAVIIIDNVVYNVSSFLDEHPGGPEVLVDSAGRDASECFHDIGHSQDAKEWMARYVIGAVAEQDRWAVRPRERVFTAADDQLTLGGLLTVWLPPLSLAAAAWLGFLYLF